MLGYIWRKEQLLNITVPVVCHQLLPLGLQLAPIIPHSRELVLMCSYIVSYPTADSVMSYSTASANVFLLGTRYFDLRYMAPCGGGGGGGPHPRGVPKGPLVGGGW